jgi:hypothetical protein
MSAADVMDKVVELSHAARATDDPDAPLIPDGNGKGHCRWCNHRDNCTAQSDQSLIKVKDMNNELISNDSGLFSLIGSPVEVIKALPDEKLTELYDAAPGIMKIFEHVAEELTTRTETKGVNGFEMAEGRGSNVWALPEEDIIKKLKTRQTVDGKRMSLDDVCPRKLITPAVALKHGKLSKAVRDKIEKDLVVFKASDKKSLKRVAFNNAVKDAKELFAGVSDNIPTLSFDDLPQKSETESVSFF